MRKFLMMLSLPAVLVGYAVMTPEPVDAGLRHRCGAALAGDCSGRRVRARRVTCCEPVQMISTSCCGTEAPSCAGSTGHYEYRLDRIRTELDKIESEVGPPVPQPAAPPAPTT